MGATRLYHNFSNRGYKVTGTLDCSACRAVKSRKKPTQKERTYQTEKANEFVYIDTSGPFKITKGGNKFWFIIVDQFTNRVWSAVCNKKSEVPGIMDRFL